MATPSYGANAWIGFGEETTWGTAVSRTDFLEVVSSSLSVERQIGFSRVTRSLDPQRKYTMMQRGTGDIVTELGFEGWLKLFKHLLGDTDTTDITGGTSYRHQFARSVSLPEGLTIETEYDQQNFIYEGCRVAQCVMAFDPEQVPTLTWTIAAETATTNGTASTPTFPSDLPVLPSTGAITIGGTDYSEHISNCSVTVTNALDAERRRVGSTSPKKPVRSASRPDVTISLELEHNSDTKALVNSFLAGTEPEFTLTYTSSDTIGASSDNYVFKVECPKVAIISGFPQLNDPGILPLTLELQALYSADTDFDVDNDQDGAIKVTIDNGESAI